MELAKKRMKNYFQKLPFNYFHYYAFSVLILLLGISSWIFWLLYIPYFYLIRYYKGKHLIIIVTLIFLIVCMSYEKVFKVKPKGNTFTVINVIKNDTYYTYYVKDSFNKYIFYNQEKLNIGDKINLDYKYEEFTKEKTPGGFNLKNYYASKRVFYKLIVKDIKVINNEFHPNIIKEKLIKGLDKYPKYTSKYLKLYLFSVDTFEEELKERRSSLGIVHLFALSGLHLNFIIGALSFIFKKLNLKLNKNIVILILLIYLWFGGFSIGLLRALMVYVMFNYFKDKGLTRLDSLSVSFLVILLINPFYRYRTGFILSFLISFMLMITTSKKGLKAKLFNHLKIILVSLLIVSNINLKIYPLSVISGFVFTLLFPFVILPVVYLSIIPTLNIFSEPLLSGFNEVLLRFDTNIYFKIPYQNLFSIVIFLSLFMFAIYSLEVKTFLKRSVLLVLFVFVLYVSPNLNFNSKIYFLDVLQGDATFIQNKFNQGNVLIDANKGTKAFLNTLGNITIDYFFITHGDYDHAAEAKEIIDEFTVKNVIVSPYDESEIIKSLNRDLIKANINDTYINNDLKIEVLGPLRKYKSLNDNSLVLRLEMFNRVYLFMGDVEEEAASDLIKTYNYKLKSDVLHVAHHGAYSGTSLEFLSYVRPKEAIISVGKNNFYNHPHPEVILNLNYYNVKIYLTSKQQTIIKKKYQLSF